MYKKQWVPTLALFVIALSVGISVLGSPTDISLNKEVPPPKAKSGGNWNWLPSFKWPWGSSPSSCGAGKKRYRDGDKDCKTKGKCDYARSAYSFLAEGHCLERQGSKNKTNKICCIPENVIPVNKKTPSMKHESEALESPKSHHRVVERHQIKPTAEKHELSPKPIKSFEKEAEEGQLHHKHSVPAEVKSPEHQQGHEEAEPPVERAAIHNQGSSIVEPNGPKSPSHKIERSPSNRSKPELHLERSESSRSDKGAEGNSHNHDHQNVGAVEEQTLGDLFKADDIAHAKDTEEHENVPVHGENSPKHELHPDEAHHDFKPHSPIVEGDAEKVHSEPKKASSPHHSGEHKTEMENKENDKKEEAIEEIHQQSPEREHHHPIPEEGAQ